MKKALPLILICVGLSVLIQSSTALRAHRATEITAAETPWVRYVMVGLGGFRGVISEILWVRAARLQEQGRYFELVQLADWITALDPRATEAWIFNAWNLSYNITAMLPDHEARLQWVNAGIDLLENGAIPANPATPRLYRELGWLYQNKIGSSDDSANNVYKIDLAKRFTDTTPADLTAVREIESMFGKLDWRLAEAHAVYWAWKGLKFADKGFEREGLRRMVRQNIFLLIHNGRFSGDTSKGIFSTKPDFALVTGLMDFCDKSLEESKGEAQIYAITLANLTKTLAENGLEDESRKTFARLSEILGAVDASSYTDIVKTGKIPRLLQ